MIKKGLAVAVILLFIGVAFAPSINAVDKLYPKEDGPYFFFIAGRINGMGSSSIPDWVNISSPFWNITYPKYIRYHFRIFSIFIVDNKLQNIRYISFPANIDLYGFKGFGPTYDMVVNRLFGYSIVIGKCDEISVYEKE